MSPIGMILLFVVTLGAFAGSAVRRYRLARVGAPEPRAKFDTFELIVERIRLVLVYVLGQKKMPANERYRAAGVAHIAIFVAFQVLLLNSLVLWIRGFYPEFDFWGVLGPESPIGMAYSLAKELSALGASGKTGSPCPRATRASTRSAMGSTSSTRSANVGITIGSTASR